MFKLQEEPRLRINRFFLILVLFSVVFVGCWDDDPEENAIDVSPTITSVCCSTDEGNEYTTNILCDEAAGTEISLMQCPSLCCQSEEGYAVIPPVDCTGGGLPSHPGHCYDVCCAIGDEAPVILLQGNCDFQNGAEVAIEECALQDEICCRYNDGTFGLALECVDGDPTTPESCEEVCCLADGASAQTMLLGSCSLMNGTAVDAAQCEEAPETTCCKTEAGIAFVPVDECDETNVLDPKLCEEKFCCKISENPGAGDAHFLSMPDCDEMGGSIVYEGYCSQQICCNTDDGPQMTAFSDCTFLQLTVTSDCIDEPQGRCCKIMDGPQAGNALWADASSCAQQGGAFVPDSFCEQELCCNTDSGFQMMPYVDCTFAQLTSTADCDTAPVEQCCKIMSGTDLGNAFMATAEDCVAQNGSVVFQEYCDQEICCDTGEGPQTMSFMECTFFQLITTEECTPAEEDECCKIVMGTGIGNVSMATASECSEIGGITTVQEYCDQIVCCSTDDGPQLVPHLECPFLSFAAFNPDGPETCDPEEEMECCKISMGPDTGNVVMATSTECTEMGGITTVQEYCDQTVCCSTEDGPQLVPFLECPFLSFAAFNPDGPESCDPPEEEECCKISMGPDTGNVVMATASACLDQGGITTVQEYCDQIVCCSTEDGPQLLPFLECPFLSFAIFNPDGPESCDPPEEEECCKISMGPNTGNVVMATASDCIELNGITTTQDYCDQMVCCNTSSGPQMISFLECPFANMMSEESCVTDCAGTPGGSATSDDCGVCDEDTSNDNTTCEQDCEGTWNGTATTDDCGICDDDTSNDNTSCEQDCEGTWNGPATTDDCGVCDADSTNDGLSCATVCCSYPGGGAGFDPATFCASGGGTVVPNEICEGPNEQVCCILGDTTDYTQQSLCAAQNGTETVLSDCQQCCKNPFGNGPEYAFPEDCDQVQPDATCAGGM